MLAPNVYEGSTEREGSVSYVAMTTFEAAAGKLMQTPADAAQSLVLKREHVTSLMQVARKKLLVAARTQLILFDDWRLVRTYAAQSNES